MGSTASDRIEKQVRLKAPVARVWRALADTKEFGAWFRAELQGRFEPGAHVTGRVTYPGYEHLKFDLWVEEVEPEHRLSFRWHPNAVDPNRDYSKEPTTRVTFTLEAVEGGTLLRVVESGFDAIPEADRLTAFRSNDEGWAEQMKNIARHVDGA